MICKAAQRFLHDAADPVAPLARAPETGGHVYAAFRSLHLCSEDVPLPSTPQLVGANALGLILTESGQKQLSFAAISGPIERFAGAQTALAREAVA